MNLKDLRAHPFTAISLAATDRMKEIPAGAPDVSVNCKGNRQEDVLLAISVLKMQMPFIFLALFEVMEKM
ncbi:hypothetical protein CHS0354_042363 [Potamilus streckersoni]|uniref:Uncharacterized protein n=1 Tax=Potamilus streckersoni TaxID=2493646 RepID=A0AAE0SUG9_9BIVA|nr:hypothetical protein CHS0354_042363 [Potamilus streckersoni]